MKSASLALVAAIAALTVAAPVSAQTASKAAGPGADAGSAAPVGPRLPAIRTPQDVDTLTHLEESEKGLAKKTLPRFNVSEGWQILSNDPELQILWLLEEHMHMALLEDFQGTPFGLMNLVSLQASKSSNSEYLVGFFTLLTERQIKSYGLNPDYAVKLSMLDYPDSPVWTAEERLALKFTRAAFENKMTDGLFAEARSAWGEKKMLRLLSWANYVHMWAMTSNVMGTQYASGDALKTTIDLSPETVKKKIEASQGLRKELLDLYFNGQLSGPKKPVAAAPGAATE